MPETLAAERTIGFADPAAAEHARVGGKGATLGCLANVAGTEVAGVDRPPDRSRGLDGEEWAAWAVLANVLAALPPALEAPLRRHGEVSLFEFQILDTLSDTSDVPMRLSTVAAQTNSSLSTLSRAVDRLQKRGHVQRLDDESDGRFTLCRLTEDGSRFLDGIAPVHADHLRRLVLDQLTTEEMHHLVSIGIRITTAARAARRGGVA